MFIYNVTHTNATNNYIYKNQTDSGCIAEKTVVGSTPKTRKRKSKSLRVENKKFLTELGFKVKKN